MVVSSVCVMFTAEGMQQACLLHNFSFVTSLTRLLSPSTFQVSAVKAGLRPS